MRVIAKRLGCLRWLAHAARHGMFLERLHMQVHRSHCGKPLTSPGKIEKMTMVSPVTQLSCASVATRVFLLAARSLPRITHTRTCTSCDLSNLPEHGLDSVSVISNQLENDSAAELQI